MRALLVMLSVVEPADLGASLCCTIMTDTTTTFDHYDASDGWESGVEVCPHCDTEFTPGDHPGPVLDEDGTKYEHVTESDPKQGPYYCPDCYKQLEANRRAHENESIEAFL